MVVGFVFNVNDPPAPLIIVQVPAPLVGVLAASVVLVTPQRFV